MSATSTPAPNRHAAILSPATATSIADTPLPPSRRPAASLLAVIHMFFLLMFSPILSSLSLSSHLLYPLRGCGGKPCGDMQQWLHIGRRHKHSIKMLAHTPHTASICSSDISPDGYPTTTLRAIVLKSPLITASRTTSAPSRPVTLARSSIRSSPSSSHHHLKRRNSLESHGRDAAHHCRITRPDTPFSPETAWSADRRQKPLLSCQRMLCRLFGLHCHSVAKPTADGHIAASRIAHSHHPRLHKP